MSDTSNAIMEQVLKSLGVDGVSVNVYLAMHESPRAAIGDVASRLNLELGEATDAVENLASLSLLRPNVVPPSGLRPVSYERAIQTLIRQQSGQLALQRESLESLQSALEDLLASPGPLRDSSGQVDIEILSGKEEIQSRIEEIVLRAAHTLDSSSPGAPVPKEVLEAARPLDAEVLERGVKVRLAYQDSLLSDSRNLEYAKWLASVGALIRRAPVLPPRFMVIDRTTAFIPTARERPVGQAMLIREPAIVALLIELFETTWAAAEPLENETQASLEQQIPTAQEFALLRILAAGSTDEAAAKKLGVSVRTVRRIMADLMERLGATSRFEAGHRATQRGWL